MKMSSKRDELKKLKEQSKKGTSIQQENEVNNPVDAYLPPIYENVDNEAGIDSKDIDNKQYTQTIHINNTHTEDNKKSLVALPEKKEAKSQRVNLLVKPSVYKLAQKECKKIGISFNECVSQLLEAFLEENK